MFEDRAPADATAVETPASDPEQDAPLAPPDEQPAPFVAEPPPQEPAPVELPAPAPSAAPPTPPAPAPVAPVPVTPAVPYRYVVRAADVMWHIWEEVTGERITVTPFADRSRAEETARVHTRRQTPPPGAAS